MKKLAMFAGSRGNYSQSFVRDHQRLLPFDIDFYYGRGWKIMHDDSPVFNPLWRLGGYLFNDIATPQLAHLYAERLAAHLNQNHYDVALAQFGTAGARVFRACEKAKLPLVVYFRGYDATKARILRRYHKHYQTMFQSAAKIVCVSADLRDSLIGMGMKPEKAEVIPSGVDHELFYGSDPASAPLVFLSVGRFVKKKHPTATLRAFAKVRSQFPDAQLVMAGDGPLKSRCKTLADELGLASNVCFPGVLSQDQVIEQMRHAFAFLQHSITADDGDREGAPKVISEAQMSGLPIVATRHGGIPEIVKEGETGFLVDEGDINAMADAMFQLARSREMAATMGSVAREWAVSELSLKRSVKKLTDLLHSLAL